MKLNDHIYKPQAPTIMEATACRSQEREPNINLNTPVPTILIGLDGYRAQYLAQHQEQAPNLNCLIDNGVVAESLRSVFPSLTFVNFYTIVTGLYPEDHGIVDNLMYDSEHDAYFSYWKRPSYPKSFWWGGEPIWITAERQNTRVGLHHWVGSDTDLGGVTPTHRRSASLPQPFKARVDRLIRWLTDKEQPIQFATLSTGTLDSAGHKYGPNSPQVAATIGKLNNDIGYLIEKLDEAGIWPNVNIIIVSDHGMTELSPKKVIVLDEIIDLDDVEVISWTPIAGIRPNPGKAEEIFRLLDQKNPYREHYQVYRREDLPDELRLKKSDRVPEIMVIADLPYTITHKEELRTTGIPRGGHGYDPAHPDMQAIFIAHGPDFKVGHRTGTLYNIDLYELMAHLLKVEPAPNDGNLDRIASQVLRDFSAQAD